MMDFFSQRLGRRLPQSLRSTCPIANLLPANFLLIHRCYARWRCGVSTPSATTLRCSSGSGWGQTTSTFTPSNYRPTIHSPISLASLRQTIGMSWWLWFQHATPMPPMATASWPTLSTDLAPRQPKLTIGAAIDARFDQLAGGCIRYANQCSTPHPITPEPPDFCHPNIRNSLTPCTSAVDLEKVERPLDDTISSLNEDLLNAELTLSMYPSVHNSARVEELVSQLRKTRFEQISTSLVAPTEVQKRFLIDEFTKLFGQQHLNHPLEPFDVLFEQAKQAWSESHGDSSVELAAQEFLRDQAGRFDKMSNTAGCPSASPAVAHIDEVLHHLEQLSVLRHLGAVNEPEFEQLKAEVIAKVNEPL